MCIRFLFHIIVNAIQMQSNRNVQDLNEKCEQSIVIIYVANERFTEV